MALFLRTRFRRYIELVQNPVYNDTYVPGMENKVFPVALGML